LLLQFDPTDAKSIVKLILEPVGCFSVEDPHFEVRRPPMRFRWLLISGLLLLALLTQARADECDPDDPTLLKPDLIELPMTHVRIIQQFRHRILTFSTAIGNVGAGPLILHGHTIQTDSGPLTQATQEILRSDGTSCTHVAGDFVFHPSHHHFHFEDFEDYQLRKDDPFTGEIVARSAKVSFCLIDIMPIRGFRTLPTVPEDCLNQEGTQGISVGWADVYDRLLPGQSIDLDADPDNPVPAGTYFLVNTANPAKRIWESDDNTIDNSYVVSINVPRPSTLTSSHPTHPNHPDHPSGPHPTQPLHPLGPHPQSVRITHPAHMHALHPGLVPINH
jgi:lysyl oxidase